MTTTALSTHFIDNQNFSVNFKKIKLTRIFPDNYQNQENYNVKDIHLFCLTPVTLFKYNITISTDVTSQILSGSFSTLYHLLTDHFDFGEDAAGNKYKLENYNIYEEIFYFSETEYQHEIEINKQIINPHNNSSPSNFLYLLYEHISGKKQGTYSLPYQRINIEGFNTGEKNSVAETQIDTKYLDENITNYQDSCFLNTKTNDRKNLADFLIKPGMLFFVKFLGRYS